MKNLTTILIVTLLFLAISPTTLQAQTRKHGKSAKLILLDEAKEKDKETKRNKKY